MLHSPALLRREAESGAIGILVAQKGGPVLRIVEGETHPVECEPLLRLLGIENSGARYVLLHDAFLRSQVERVVLFVNKFA